MDSQAMIDYIRSFRLDSCRHGNQGYSRVLLQLFGYTGHGKSSFINSCKYVMDDGPYKVYAKVARSDDKPETMIRNTYELTDTVTMVDNRGCVKMNKDETGEIYAQLGNFLPLDCEVKWHSGFKDMNQILLSADLMDQSADFIVPVLVYSAQKQIAPAEEGELRELVKKVKNITGLFPTVVITHKLSEHLRDTEEKFRMTGAENMFPVENYTEQDHLKTRGKHEGLLKCLYEIIRDVEFRMRERRDPLKEKIERKRILYEFAHNREMEKVQEIANSERARREELERKIGEARKHPYFHYLCTYFN
ncbi:uncharacterized protein LOC130284598 [Hyla sarda]|uniref:uncharacterized protein LOC130284598 n=1 Tax=Hyla sarda TaxID=327740 RepID=UPI0024C2F7B4|nr:uncharacterized protein LOC130284598 [Hyla sarda]